MAVGSGLPHRDGDPFEVRYSDGSLARADVAADACVYSNRLFSAEEPDIAVVVADSMDRPDNGLPYGLPFSRDEPGEIRPGIVVMPAGGGDFWSAIAQGLRPKQTQRAVYVFVKPAFGWAGKPVAQLTASERSTSDELGNTS
jgi:hypothetical protein